MDERMYRRMFCETPRQVFMRHNNIRAMRAYRKCRTCNPQGSLKAPTKCTSRKPCNEGWRSYKIASI